MANRCRSGCACVPERVQRSSLPLRSGAFGPGANQAARMRMVTVETSIMAIAAAVRAKGAGAA